MLVITAIVLRFIGGLGLVAAITFPREPAATIVGILAFAAFGTLANHLDRAPESKEEAGQ